MVKGKSWAWLEADITLGAVCHLQGNNKHEKSRSEKKLDSKKIVSISKYFVDTIVKIINLIKYLFKFI